jgi:predicted transcriptional regulator
MARLLVFLAIILAVSPVFGAGPIKYIEYNVDIEVLQNQKVSEVIELVFPESVDSFNYYFLYPVSALSIFGDGAPIDCELGREVLGSQVICSNINASKIELHYDYSGNIQQKQDYFMLSGRYIFSTPTDMFRLTVTLPPGYIIAEEGLDEVGLMSYNPDNAIRGTDGRRITLTWERKPSLGDIFSFSVTYEQAFGPQNPFGRLGWAVAFAVFALMVIIFVYYRRKPALKEYQLNKDERKILDALLKEDKISQRKICRDTGFSKAHVSRIAKNLEERGIIERKKKGRSYEVRLKK